MHHVPRHVQQVSLTAEIKFCGLTCENPFFLASSAVCTNYEMVAKAFDARRMSSLRTCLPYWSYFFGEQDKEDKIAYD
jgi:hypothetical protein